jgi:hypothetical protein
VNRPDAVHPSPSSPAKEPAPPNGKVAVAPANWRDPRYQAFNLMRDLGLMLAALTLASSRVPRRTPASRGQSRPAVVWLTQLRAPRMGTKPEATWVTVPIAIVALRRDAARTAALATRLSAQRPRSSPPVAATGSQAPLMLPEAAEQAAARACAVRIRAERGTVTRPTR